MKMQEQENLLIQIGKNGLTQNVVLEIARNLNRKKIVKVKFLQSFIANNNRKEAASQLIELLGKMALEKKMVGNTIMLKKLE